MPSAQIIKGKVINETIDFQCVKSDSGGDYYIVLMRGLRYELLDSIRHCSPRDMGSNWQLAFKELGLSKFIDECDKIIKGQTELKQEKKQESKKKKEPSSILDTMLNAVPPSSLQGADSNHVSGLTNQSPQPIEMLQQLVAQAQSDYSRIIRAVPRRNSYANPAIDSNGIDD